VFGLKRKAAQILAIIKRRQGVISKDVIYHILYGGLPECEQPTIKTIEVHMVAIRVALWTHGIVIRTVAVGGYMLDAGARARLATLMGEYQASPGSDHVGDALTLRAVGPGCAVGCRRMLNTGDVLKAQVRLPSPGDEALVKCRVLQHFGDDLLVTFESPRGPTTVQIGASEIVKVVR
jgi:hypothetical protein